MVSCLSLLFFLPIFVVSFHPRICTNYTDVSSSPLNQRFTPSFTHPVAPLDLSL